MRPTRFRRLARPLAFGLAALALVLTPATSPAQTDAETTGLFVYFLRDGKVASARRTVELDPEKRVGRASLLALLAGPNETERDAGLTTALPVETELLDLTLDQTTSVATIDLSNAFAAPPAENDATPTAETAPVRSAARARLAQVVYTLTQFPSVVAVAFLLDGQPVETFDPGDDEPATDLSEPVDRSDVEDVTPLIFVESPTVGDEVASPVRVVGTANTFEAVFFLRVLDEDGEILVEQQAMATSGTGTRGTFDVEVPFAIAESGPGTLVAFDRSPRDGAIENVVEIPVALVG